MAFGLHWEWRGFAPSAFEGMSSVESLPRKFPDAQRVLDEYLWAPGLRVNVKLRASELKFKRLVEKRGDFERWQEDTRENYPFPLGSEPVAKLCAELEIASRPSLPLRSPADLLAWLERVAVGLRRVSVLKTRTQHEWIPDAGGIEPVIVELARIEAPERLVSAALEHPQLEILEQAVRCMRFAETLLPRSYFEAVSVWARGETIFSGAPPARGGLGGAGSQARP